MKTWEKWVLTVIVVVFLLTLFPPFLGGNSNGEEKNIGFHFLFGTPTYKSPREKVSRSYETINGEKKMIAERRWYPKRKYNHYRIDSVRYMFLIILMTLPLAFAWIILRRRKALLKALPTEAPE